MFNFQDLEVYKKAKLFHLNCRALLDTRKFDSHERDQLKRASFSVPLNIAEGSVKFSKADRRNFYTTARASVFECFAILEIMLDQGKISKLEMDQLQVSADQLSRMLFAMIKNLEK